MVFEIVLFGLVVLSGVVILFCRFVVPSLAKKQPEPWYLDYARSFFPVLLLVFLLRGFVAEPFRIPSGSMYPTLEVGDFILVNKFSYGLRLPIVRTKVFEIGDPQRGDIVVFKYPRDPKQSYIKRLIGLPGDIIQYRDSTLYINGEKLDQQVLGEFKYRDQADQWHTSIEWEQVIPTSTDADGVAVKYGILQDNRRSKGAWKVPEGQYFMMGDNRGNSADSRVWGFLPEENIVGKAFFVWMSWGDEDNEEGGGLDFDRIGTRVQAEIVNTGAN
ncbi:signal peptidase I [Arenicella xantha]|uniref:Signal peptidase I n=1 Tax=Arenicella xantha TaxID=644221 RepID=A0A395JH25_9GAMM|nr:signal peptidase I [Arenicella xantha]RBP49270.1 signal peptidase I [Arenicella xantha]